MQKPLEIVADLGLEEDVDRLFRETITHFDGRLDLLVNNAGISWPVSHEDADKCYEAFKAIIQVNLNSSVRLTLLAAPALRSTAQLSGGGSRTSIVFVGSIGSQRPTEALAAYSSSKAALLMYARSMASELGPHVRVNTIVPGPVATKIVERAGSSLEQFEAACGSKTILGRIGWPEEIAEAILFLADSKKAGFITGTELVIDGGCLTAPICWSK